MCEWMKWGLEGGNIRILSLEALRLIIDIV